MSAHVYEKLQNHLDRLPMGFPKSKSGVEIQILKKLFSPDEAEIACALNIKPEKPEMIAERLDRDIQSTRDKLDEMSRKGLIFRTKKNGETVFSGAAFVVGIYEYQVKRMNREFAEKNDQYLKERFFDEMHRGEGSSSFLRVVPVGKSVIPELGVYQYEEIKEIIRQQDKITVTDCICRVKAGLLGHPCDRPQETCFAFGAGADFYAENGWGRAISQEEALSILDNCDQEALVLTPSNAQRPVAICACCSCCCDFIHNLKRFDHPALVAQASFCAQVNSEQCEACETCQGRCQMEAIAVGDSTAEVDETRCIGCGLCVTTCPNEAISLYRRNDAVIPPERIGHLFKQLAVERGKI